MAADQPAPGPLPPDRDPPVQPLPDRPMVFVDDWIAELGTLRQRLEASALISNRATGRY